MKKITLILISVLILSLVLVGCSKPVENIENEDNANNVIKDGKNDEVEDVENTDEEDEIIEELDLAKIIPDEKEREYAESLIGAKAPDFTVTNLKGETIKLSDYVGKKVIVEFSQTKCPACIESYPVLEEFKNENEDYVVIKIYPKDTKESMEEFFETNNFEPIDDIIAGNGKIKNVVEAYNIKYTPTMIFVDEEGIIRLARVTKMDKEMLIDMTNIAFNFKK